MQKAFGLKIWHADGKEITPEVRRSGADAYGAVQLAAGASFSVWRKALLEWGEDSKPQLAYFDGSGTETVFGPLPPGQYKLAFWYDAANGKAKQSSSDLARWGGEVVTQQLPFRILEGETQGTVSDVVRRPGGANEVCRVRQSSPVTRTGQGSLWYSSPWMVGKKTAPVCIQFACYQSE